MFEGLLQPTHLILILLIGLIVLGPGKLGDLGGQLGRGIREFKQNVDSPLPPTRAITSGDGTRFCTQCGAGSQTRNRFCPQCGATASDGEIRSAG